VLIFKYLGCKAAHASLKEVGGFSLRFNLPENYNDPYELFLTPDEPLNLRERAYFDFFLREMPQAPVTCFSRRPDSVVMWAHYCQQASGICLAIDESELFTQIDYGFIHDVEYHEDPPEISATTIRYPLATGKRRHALGMLAIARRAAYFKKRIDWQYEQERRLVVPTDAVTDHDGLLLSAYKANCIHQVIVGPFVDETVLNLVEKWASASKVPIVRMHYSRRIHAPFFVSNGKTMLWKNDQFFSTKHSCPVCYEPTEKKMDICEWCQITDRDKEEAGASNLLTLCLQTGTMEALPLDFNGIECRGKKVE